LGRSIDEITSVLGDLASIVTLNPTFAMATNAGAAADAELGGRNKDALGFALQSIAAPVASAVGGAVGSGVSNAFMPAASGETTAEFLASGGAGFGQGFNAVQNAARIGAGVGDLAGLGAASQTTKSLEPGLAKMLGVSQNATPTSPTGALSATKKPGTGGGAGASAGPGGMDVQGGTAPQIYPYVKPATSASPQQQQQPKGI